MTTAMSEAAAYSACEALPDGRLMEIRTQRPDNRANFVTAVSRTSAQSFYRRFFDVRHEFTEREIAAYLKIDFTNHVALVAVMEHLSDGLSSAEGAMCVSSRGRPRWRSPL